MFRDLQRYAIPEYAHRWKCLGAQLHLDQSELNVIFSETPTDSKVCCRKMLHKWLEKDTDASWDKLFLAIDKLASYQGTVLCRSLLYCQVENIHEGITIYYTKGL